jgi:hypothetical protein
MADLGLSDLLSLVQTCAIIVALVATLYFSRRQVEGFTKDLESRVLNDIDEKFHSIGEILVDQPDLVQTIYTTPTNQGKEVPFAYYVLFFCAHVHHMRERGILQDNEWVGWLQWMRNAFRFGSLGRAWSLGEMGQWFDPSFRSFVEAELLPHAGPKP